jgi:hypothetical protein
MTFSVKLTDREEICDENRQKAQFVLNKLLNCITTFFKAAVNLRALAASTMHFYTTQTALDELHLL